MTGETGDQTENESDQADAADAAAQALRRATRSTAPRKAPKAAPSVPTYSGRDPQPVSRAVDDLLTQRGWRDESAIAHLMAQWPEIVGQDLAEHVRPTGFREGVLSLTAESTAWATQVRLLIKDLHAVVDQQVGAGIVTSISVQGPTAPSWVAGPRRVKGRGPRDTYG